MLRERVDGASTPDIEGLAAAASQGDLDAMARLYDHFSDSVWRLCYTLLNGDRAAADDASGETWLRVARDIRRYTPKGAGFLAWLRQIARRASVDQRRTAAFRKEMPTPDLLELDGADDGEGPEAAALRNERTRQVVQAVRRLPQRQRQVLALRFWYGYSLQEVASILNIESNAVKQLQHRAFKNIRVTLGDSEVGVRRATAITVTTTNEDTRTC